MKRLFTFIAIIGAGILLNACFFKDPNMEAKFQGILIEIENATMPGDPNTKETRYYEIIKDGRFTPDSLKINLVAAPQNEDIVVKFEVAPGADAAGTTAVLGVHYRLISNGEVVIPAGKNYGWLKFEVNDDTLSPSTPIAAIRINLTSTSKGLLSENFKTHRFLIQGKCTYNISRFVGNYLVDEPMYGQYNATLTQTGTNEVETDNFWDVGANVRYQFNPTTGAVSIVPTTFTFGSNTFNVTTNTSAPASDRSFDPCGNFKAAYIVRLGSTIGSGTIVDQNVHTYTKQ